MGWTTPRTWVPGEVGTATNLNTHLRDNLIWLQSGRARVWSTNASSYSTTSTTFVDVSNTNLKITASITSGRAFGFFTFRPSHSYTTAGGTWTCYLRTMLNGTTIDNSQQSFLLSSSLVQSMIVPFYYSGLAVGSHYVTLQWMISGSGGAGYTAYANATHTMYMMEV